MIVIDCTGIYLSFFYPPSNFAKTVYLKKDTLQLLLKKRDIVSEKSEFVIISHEQVITLACSHGIIYSHFLFDYKTNFITNLLEMGIGRN